MSSREDGGIPPVNWRESIVSQLRSRNRQQCSCFQELVTSHNRLFDSANTLRHENLQLSIQNEKLRMERVERPGAGQSDNAFVASLEAKLLTQQEQLTELHKKWGDNAQLLIDLNKKLQEKEKQITSQEETLTELIIKNKTLAVENQQYKLSKAELEQINQVLRDEYQALQLEFTHLETKLRNVQEENQQMVEKIMKYKSKDAEKLNEENENFIRKKHAKLQKELEDAAKDMRGLSPDAALGDVGPFSINSAVPTTAAIVFDAHDGEVSAVKWSPVDKLLVTGGSDRKLKLWDTTKGTAESRGMLTGSNAGVMSIDFDTNGSFILGASNDFAARIWTLTDKRLRHTFTGHSGKVLAAKFFGEQTRVVTGSHDRTLKIWDLRSRSCIETKFANSCCNDLVISDGAGTTIISGHFDKKIKFWDPRSECHVNEIAAQGKVTSLDLSKDCKTLLCCVRDDTLRIIDLRMNQFIATFSAEGFKVGCDWSKAAFNTECDYVAAGGSDGGVYVWQVSTQTLHSVLKHHKTPVLAVAWHPYANYLASADRNKTVVVWADL